MSVFKLLYRHSVSLMGKLHAYEERAGRYLGSFRGHIDKTEVVLDVGSGPGLFSKALAHKDRLVIALDIDRDALKRIQGTFILKVYADSHSLPFHEGSARQAK